MQNLEVKDTILKIKKRNLKLRKQTVGGTKTRIYSKLPKIIHPAKKIQQKLFTNLKELLETRKVT